MRLIYQPPSRMGVEVTFESAPLRSNAKRTPAEVTIDVITPLFYSRFVYYAHSTEAFDREGVQAHESNRTVSVTDMHVLGAILEAKGPRVSRNCNISVLPSFDYIDRLRWQVLKSLRLPPPPMDYPDHGILRSPTDRPSTDERRAEINAPGHALAYRKSDIRTFGLSPLDVHVRQATTFSNKYLRSVLQLFVAERICLGQPVVLAILDLLLRTCLIYLSVSSMDQGADKSKLSSTGHQVNRIVLAGLCHYWSLLKGV